MYMCNKGKNTYVIIRYITKNSNTAEHGFGDYPETISRQEAIINGDTPRKALNAFNKVFNEIYIGGRFPNGRIIDVKDYDETCERIYGKLPPYAYD